MANNNLSKKIIILGAITFWLFIYSLALIVVFQKFGFEIWMEDRVGPKGTFWQTFYQPFFSVLMAAYHPLYILPLFLAGYWAKRRRLLLEILSLFLSALFFFPYFLMWGLTVGHEGAEFFTLSFPAFGAQIIFSLVLGAIFYYGKEKIIKKLMFISLILFLVIVGYITFSAKVASGAKVAIEDLLQKAIEARDVSLCEKILEEGRERKVYSRNPGTIVGGTYKRCIDTIALALGDESICDIYGKYNAECHKEIFLKSTNLCKDVPKVEQIKCIQKIAIETNDVELCKKILGGVECIAPIAVNTKNLNLCFSEEINYPLPWEPNPYSCFKEAFRTTDDVDICNTLEPKHSNYKDGCLSEASSKLNNPKLCETVGTGGYSYSCYDGPGSKPHACLPDMNKSDCFRKFFSKAKNFQACEEVKEGVDRDTCFFVAARDLNNIQLCEKIKEEKWREWCLKGIGP